ncbi:hypothetical protein AVEN_21091-1 [Araneus ventricosus]|uniref:Uncharacterized protein n=1 Tax=Araneus ventricosus TaxID=182803 RepID=A0A4Y2AJ69_ARAVE|nr:hypothetical protein AVEN_21091-1 [Araneus ventricosus]
MSGNSFMGSLAYPRGERRKGQTQKSKLERRNRHWELPQGSWKPLPKDVPLGSHVAGYQPIDTPGDQAPPV